MNCTWQAGRNAPGDTQYFLYWQNSRDDDVMECELYIKDENGRHMGCRFKNVMIGNKKAYFVVNGSSEDSLIQFYDEYIELYEVEKLMPPSNVTVNCDSTSNNCTIKWRRPQISHFNVDKCFKYEVKITSKVNLTVRTKLMEDFIFLPGDLKYEFKSYSVKIKYVLKIRARGKKTCFVSRNWGEWSEPVEFGKMMKYSS
ncbi:CSF2R factor, partial [Penelope pileata]|nr:CSF2R factor [Penelope pileata]